MPARRALVLVQAQHVAVRIEEIQRQSAVGRLADRHHDLHAFRGQRFGMVVDAALETEDDDRRFARARRARDEDEREFTDLTHRERTVMSVHGVDGQAQGVAIERHRPGQVGDEEHDGAYLAVSEHGMSPCVIPFCWLPREGDV